MNLFSVVIPLYNKEQSIANTIQSVLNQSFQEFEVVIINDGSTDNSVQVVQGINDQRIRLIHQENQGVSAARNKGIEEAKNEWIAFLDGDDLWEVNHLEEIVKMMKAYPQEKVYVTSFKYSDNREFYRHTRKKPIFKIKDYFKDVVKENLIWTSIVVIHRDCFINVGMFNTKYIRGEDIDLWIRLAKNYNIIKTNKITAIYRVEAENRSNSTSVPIKKTYLCDISLKKATNNEELNFYKHYIITQVKYYLVNKEWKSLLFLIWKHNFKLLN